MGVTESKPLPSKSPVSPKVALRSLDTLLAKKGTQQRLNTCRGKGAGLDCGIKARPEQR